MRPTAARAIAVRAVQRFVELLVAAVDGDEQIATSAGVHGQGTIATVEDRGLADAIDGLGVRAVQA